MHLNAKSCVEPCGSFFDEVEAWRQDRRFYGKALKRAGSLFLEMGTAYQLRYQR